MEAKTKRAARTKNFSFQEVELLGELTESLKDILENKKSDASVWESKNWAWQDITKEFNKRGLGVTRTIDQLKSRYHSIDKRKGNHSNNSQNHADASDHSFEGNYPPQLLLKLESNSECEDYESQPKKSRSTSRTTKPQSRSSWASQSGSAQEGNSHVTDQKLQHAQQEHDARMKNLGLEEQELKMKLEILRVELEIKQETLRRLRET